MIEKIISFLKKRKVLLLLCLISILFFSTLDNNLGGFWGDGARYILLAKSIASGQGYREIYSLGNPPHTSWPFMFPLLLTPIIYFFGYDLLLMKLPIVLMAIFSMYFSYLLLKKYVDVNTSLLIMLLTSSAPFLVYSLREIMADIPYLFFSLLSLLFLEEYNKEKSVINKQLLFATLFVVLAYFTRKIGITIWATAIIYLLFSGKFTKIAMKKTVLFSFFFLIPILLWAYRTYRVSGSRAFQYELSFLMKNSEIPELGTIELFNLLERTAQHFWFYINEAGKIIFQQYELVAFSISIITFSIITFGFLFCILKKRNIIEYYILVYFGLLLILCYKDTRFLLPILPFIVYYFIMGLKTLLKILNGYFPNQRLIRYIFVITVGSILLSNVWKNLTAIKNNQFFLMVESKYVEHLENFNWIKQNTPRGSIIMCRRTHVAALFTERKTVSFLFTKNINKVMSYIYKNQVDYIILNQIWEETSKYMIPVVEKNSDKFSTVREEGNNVVLKVVK